MDAIGIVLLGAVLFVAGVAVGFKAGAEAGWTAGMTEAAETVMERDRAGEGRHGVVIDTPGYSYTGCRPAPGIDCGTESHDSRRCRSP